MNVIFANATQSWGGVKTWMLLLAEFLAERGHAVTLVCRPGDALVTRAEGRGLRCLTLRFGMDFSPRTVSWFWQLLRAARDEHTADASQGQVVVTNISKDVRTAGVAARLAGIAHVNRLGDIHDLHPSLRTRLLYDLLVDRVFVPSRHLETLYAQHDFLRCKLRAFPNALVVPPLTTRSGGPVRCAIVARLSRRKQVDKVLQAFAQLANLPWELHIGGFGPELDCLQRLARTLGLGERVRWAGLVDPRDFLADKDIGILYSAREAFGYAILEYLAAGCAVIAANVGGIPEIVTHDVDGILVDPGSTASLEHALRRLIRDPSLRQALAESGHRTAERRFSREQVFPAVEAELGAAARERALRRGPVR